MKSLQRADVLALKASPSVYLPLADAVSAGDIEGLRPLRVSFLASFTAEPLRPYVVVEATPFGLKTELWFGPFNQFEQQILDARSGAYSAPPDVVVLALRIEEASPAIAGGAIDESVAEQELASLRERIEGMVNGVRARTTAPILIWNFADPYLVGAGLADAISPTPQIEVIQKANAMLAELARSSPGVHIFDARRLAVELGRAHWHDAKLFHMARIPFSPEAQRFIGRRLARYLNALVKAPRKCLILDLDNTLWGGVVGEEGVGGIALGEEYPGSAYKTFQRYLLSLKRRGVLLAIASKNNPEDALEVLRDHPDCLLRPNDFVAVHIGWNNKAESIAAVARQLNVGIDSLVFFDDSAVERESVRREYPDVLVVDVPPSPLGYIDALEDAGAFDFLHVSIEDRRRTEAYIEQRERDSLRRMATNPEEFLRALEMRAKIGRVDNTTLGRVVQLLAKTNQFNVTTRRHDAAAIQRLLDDGAIVLWMRLEDRFGDNGLTGVAIARPSEARVWTVDSLLLSCRIIGRQAERALLGRVCRLVRESGATELRGEYIPSPKNAPAANVFADCGFVSMDDKGSWWRWDCESGDVPEPNFIAVELVGG